MSWPEVKQAKDEKRHELVLSGPDVASRVKDGGLDDVIYKLTTLNFLEISRAGLPDLSDSLGNLTNMTNLVLHGNQLKSVPSSIGAMTKLKYLNLSNNAISELPDELGELKELESLNVSCNQLSSFLHVGELCHLHILDVSHNQLEALPEGVTSPDLAMLAQILASNNKLKELPADFADLPALRTVDVENNLIDVIPPELSNCMKLKEFNYRGNKLKDRRLAKMMDQCSTKAVLDYLRGQLSKGGGGKGKGKKGKGKKDKAKEVVVEDSSENIINVLHFPEEGGVEIQITPSVADARPYIVCCIVRDINLQKTSNMFKRFITLQTKLHDGVCQKRQASTIATHDLKAVKCPLKYDARTPSAISLVPLFKSKPTTADKLVDKLYQEAEEIRKEKKRNTLSGIHKYLDLVHGKPSYACLMDNEGTVISFPPITNCDITKVSKETTDLLIEVTSTLNLDTCKKALDELLQGMLEMGLGKHPEGGDVGGAVADSQGPLLQDQRLVVEQVKILDTEGLLKVVYPSRTDLQSNAFRVERNYE